MKKLAKNPLEDLEHFSLFELQLHMHEHIVEDVSRISAVIVLDASPFEQDVILFLSVKATCFCRS